MTAPKPCSPAELKEILRYDAASGVLYWRPRTTEQFSDSAIVAEVACELFNRTFADQAVKARTRYRKGTKFVACLQMRVKGRSCFCHRVIWALVYGEWPNGSIDHIDGNPTNNRIENLRVVDTLTNNRNRRTSARNTSGFQGIKKTKFGGWQAVIVLHGKTVNLGSYAILEHALAARKAAEVRLGFHPNHGSRREAML